MDQRSKQSVKRHKEKWLKIFQKCSSSAIGVVQMNTTLIFYLVPIRMSNIKKITGNKSQRGFGRGEHSFPMMVMQTGTPILEISVENPQ